MEGDYCYCCGKPVGMAKERKNRSKLGSPKLQGVQQVLSQFVSEVSSEVDVEKLKDGFGCRNCIDKLKQYADKHREVASNAIPVLPKVPAADLESPASLPTATTNVRGPSQQESPVVRIRSAAASPPVTVCV
jgi:hypothetical protein